MRALTLWLLACISENDAYRQALTPETPMDEALDLCHKAGALAEECVSTVVRNNPDAPAEALVACAALKEERWQGECYFVVAEGFSRSGDRWSALTACGHADMYYHECLYHIWSFELQKYADDLGQAANGVAAVTPSIEFWSQIETIGRDPEAMLWEHWWFFAHTRNKPARRATCATLSEADRARCEEGTRGYVYRTVLEALWRIKDEGQKDRLCRRGVAELQVFLPDAWEPDPVLDEAAAAALTDGCNGKTDRPWNPVFRPRSL